jgi:heme-degrading monooxygenase HmoA
MIVGVNVFSFKKGLSKDALKHIQEHIDLDSKQKGFIEAFVAKGVDNPDQYFVISRWRDIKSYEDAERAYMQSGQKNQGLMKMMEMLENKPTFGRFVVLRDSGKETELINMNFIMKHCRNCGMPMKNQEDFANGDKSSDLCIHCNRKDSSIEEKINQRVKEHLKEQGMTEEEAERVLRKWDKTGLSSRRLDS